MRKHSPDHFTRTVAGFRGDGFEGPGARRGTLASDDDRYARLRSLALSIDDHDRRAVPYGTMRARRRTNPRSDDLGNRDGRWWCDNRVGCSRRRRREVTLGHVEQLWPVGHDGRDLRHRVIDRMPAMLGWQDAAAERAGDRSRDRCPSQASAALGGHGQSLLEWPDSGTRRLQVPEPQAKGSRRAHVPIVVHGGECGTQFREVLSPERVERARVR